MERPAFDRLLADALPMIEGAARKYATIYRCFNEWHDISQSALLKMLRFADLYDPDKGDLLPWACVVIINTIKTHIAKNVRAVGVEDFNDLIIDCTPAYTDYSPEEQLQAAFVLSNLNEETRLYTEGYNYSEIAARCGFRGKATAKARIDNCAQSLCRVLGIAIKQQRRQRMCPKMSG